MTITLRIAARPDARAAILRDPDLARTAERTGMIFEIDANDPLLDRLLDLTRNTSGVSINPVMTFSSAELAQARWFQPECRGKIVKESKQDYAANRARLDATPFQQAHGRELPIKIIDRLTFSKVDNVAANAFACAGDWMAEFLAGAAVAAAFRDASLADYEMRQVVDAKTGAPQADVFHLFTASIMPPAELDATTIQLNTETRSWRELGCLSYAPATAAGDFNRTAENFSNNYMPIWVVSPRVRDCVQDAKLKGWAFRPVLETGTPLHAAYLQTWSGLLARVAVNPRNRF